MDFFEHQQQARQRTGLLLFYFFLAVFLTVAALNLLAWLAAGVSLKPAPTLGQWLAMPYWFLITGTTLLVMLTGSLVRYFALSDGGHVVAEMVHARRIRPDTVDPRERMLLNVVEEMAIASGVPVPSVWVMDDEPGINAFVAGFEPTQAVLVITRGGLDTFDREQLQGVVGHEFSHILNGDMRLNVQLFAILAGILLLGRIGEFLLRSFGRVRSSNSRDDGKGVAFILLIGIGLYVVGYAGLFCGRLIKAAISRQREFLADASSVQFTRNPQGIGEALLTIRNAAPGSQLQSSRAEDMSHMCIALPVQLSGMLATHPPLEDRIKAIDPALLARDRARRHMAQATAAQTAATPAAIAEAVSGFGGSNGNAVRTLSGAALTASVGRPQPANMDYAQQLAASIPQAVRELLHRPDGARQVLYGLVIAGTADRLEADAIAAVVAAESDDFATATRALLPDLRQLGTRLRLPCHDLALPTLRQLAPEGRQHFLETVERLVRIDGRVSLREYLTLALLRKHLATDAPARRAIRFRRYAEVADPLNVVFSLLCHAAGGSNTGRTDLHARVLRGFLGTAPPMAAADTLDANRLHGALLALADLSPLMKKPLLDACVDCVRHDGVVQVAEIELVRAVGEALDCPVPPLVG